MAAIIADAGYVVRDFPFDRVIGSATAACLLGRRTNSTTPRLSLQMAFEARGHRKSRYV